MSKKRRRHPVKRQTSIKSGDVVYAGQWETRVVRMRLSGEYHYSLADVQFVDGEAVYWEPYEHVISPIREFKTFTLWMMGALGKPMIDGDSLDELETMDEIIEIHDDPSRT